MNWPGLQHTEPKVGGCSVNWPGLHHTEPMVGLISWTIFCGFYLTVPNQLRGIGCPLISVVPSPLAIPHLLLMDMALKNLE